MIWGKTKVKFADYMVGVDGIELHPVAIKAVNQSPTPAKFQDLKCVIGLINQLMQSKQAVTKASYM